MIKVCLIENELMDNAGGCALGWYVAWQVKKLCLCSERCLVESHDPQSHFTGGPLSHAFNRQSLWGLSDPAFSNGCDF